MRGIAPMASELSAASPEEHPGVLLRWTEFSMIWSRIMSRISKRKERVEKLKKGAQIRHSGKANIHRPAVV